MTDLTATAATLNAVFTKAAPGDVLKLSGLFALAVLQGRVFDPPLTVDASGATLQAAVIKGVAGLRWTGGTFATLTRGRDAVNVSASQGITVERLSVTGDGTAGAVSFRDCQDVALTDSQIEGPRVGASLYNVARARIVGNLITGWSADAIGLSAVSDSLISQNSLTNPKRIDPDIHIDGIQGYFTGPTVNRDLTVSFNFIRGLGTQGIFFNTAAGYPPPERIHIEGNIVAIDAVHGVTLMGDPAGIVKNNRIFTLPGAQWQARLYISDPNTARFGNIAAAYGSWKAEVD